MSRLRLFVSCLGILLILSFGGRMWAAPFENQKELTAAYRTIVDEENTIIFQTGLAIQVGDQYINEDNKLYEITSVEGSLARARYIVSEPQASLEDVAIPVQGGVDSAQPIIAVYHTHTDESYIPTDGTSTRNGNGSIMLVGDAFAKGLTSIGYQVIHDKTLHCPHDANAYQRSRRTFVKLLAQQPLALFDIHRDSAPLAMYKTTINGFDAVKILLVVGQQNQNKQTTLEYVKTVKTKVDAKYKGLIRGIFIARGNYNQDLNPRSMLIEMGTQYNTLKAAQYSAVLFASVFPSFIPVANPPSPSTSPSATTAPSVPGMPSPESNPIIEESKGTTAYGYDIAFILGMVLIGIIAYLYLCTGSWQEGKRKLSGFFKYEFKDFFHGRTKKKK